MFSFVNSYIISASSKSNNITIHDVKTNNYYGKKAIIIYGLVNKHSNGNWITYKKNLFIKHPTIGNSLVLNKHNSWELYQASGSLSGGYFKFSKKGVIFKSLKRYSHETNNGLYMKIKRVAQNNGHPIKFSKITYYINKNGGKKFIRSIKTLSTMKEIYNKSMKSANTNNYYL